MNLHIGNIFLFFTFISNCENTNGLIIEQDGKTLDVSFLLYTRENPKSPQNFTYSPNDKEITNSFFKSSQKTKFIVHGYLGKFIGGDWTERMKDYFLNYSDYNVFGVDWSKPASSSNYFESASNTKIVGQMIAHFINRLVDVRKATPKDMHCAGHSLGAHTCGFAGKNLDNLSLPKLDEISGLDPAGPAFWVQGPKGRLDPSDANLVLVMHSTTVFPGYSGNLGHIDFRPNGATKQPGCENGKPDCEHMRATEFPISSLNKECQYIGYKCTSYTDFKDGKCADCGLDNDKCKPMEFDFKFWDHFDRSKLSSNGVRNDFYLTTSDSQPFCMFHYQVLVQIGEGGSNARGVLEIELTPTANLKYHENSIGAEMEFKTGEKYSRLYHDKNELGSIDNIKVKWSSFFKNTVKIEKISVNFMSHIDKSVRKQKSSTFCQKSMTSLAIGSSEIFNKC